MKKNIITTIIALVLSIGFAFGVGYTAKAFAPEGGEDKVLMEVPKPDDITLPEHIRDDGFGLFFYNADGTRNRIDQANLNFDPNKPTIIFCHGVQYLFGYKGDEEMTNPEGWVEAGWNAGIFMWSQYSDGWPWGISSKVWSRDAEMSYAYEDETGKRVYVKDSCLNYSLAECFVAYYLDFMGKQNYKGKEIRFSGLSLGSQMMVAITNYMLTLEDNGAITAEFLPDRVAIHDAYMTTMADDNVCNWMNKPIGENGNSFLAIDTMKMLTARGIAVEYFESSDLVKSPKGWDLELFKKLPEVSNFLFYRSDWESDINTKHCLSKNWYLSAINDGIDYYDDADSKGLSLAVSPKTPTSYTFARKGVRYDMEENMTAAGDDDVQYSTGLTHPTLAGFAFNDADKDGNNDERLVGRLDGVKISLYLKENGGDKLMGTTVTKKGGYYSFDIDEIYVNKDGANYGHFYVSVELPEGYSVTGKGNSETFPMMTNDINSDKKSGEFVFSDKVQLKIINVGLTK